MKGRALLGCRVRSGRAAAILLAYPADNSRLLDSREFSLADPDDNSTIQPYHADFGTLEVDQARIAPRVRAITRAAQASVKEAVAAWHSRRLQVTVAALVVGTSSILTPSGIRTCVRTGSKASCSARFSQTPFGAEASRRPSFRTATFTNELPPRSVSAPKP